MPNYHYDVQECKLSGDEIRRVSSLPGFGMIIFQLQEVQDPSGHTDGLINVSLTAADAFGNPLPGASVNVSFPTRRIVPLKNNFEPREIKLTKKMIEEAATRSKAGPPFPRQIVKMKFKGRQFTYRGDEFPNDKNKDFVGYAVKTKRKW